MTLNKEALRRRIVKLRMRLTLWKLGNPVYSFYYRHNPFIRRFNGYANPKDEPRLQRWLWNRYSKKHTGQSFDDCTKAFIKRVRR